MNRVCLQLVITVLCVEGNLRFSGRMLLFNPYRILVAFDVLDNRKNHSSVSTPS
jgi:hypothetical protein